MSGCILNLYPDSLGGSLTEAIALLRDLVMTDAFRSLYILPSLFHSDIDRGFSIVDYGLNEELASRKDINDIASMGYSLMLDFLINHISVKSEQFQDLLHKGSVSEYCDFFIDWNQFWKGYGDLNDEGVVIPNSEYIKYMLFRKPGLPILMINFPDGSKAPYWNTFYQSIDSNGEYLGQMDLNIKSERVWDYYRETLRTLSGYGAEIIRLDAFAYAPKEPGARNFLNEPGTWTLLEKVREIATEYGLRLLPEIHAAYSEGTYAAIAEKGYLTYDFFLPGLIIDAIESGSGTTLKRWADEQTSRGIHTINMLGCHDGIPLLDLKGMLPDERIQSLIDLVVSRGGYVKNLHGAQNIYYQVNATYYSALGEDDRKLLLARAIQLFMPGIPQVWYLDLFAGKNDYDAVKRAGEGGHKEINRTNLTRAYAQGKLNEAIVKRQLDLCRYRNTCPAFGDGAVIDVTAQNETLTIRWTRGNHSTQLNANLRELTFDIV
ncbi:dextransucrase [Clostridia bacterium]|nr:dextransucrase [Clostridia bacterium]